ncbi:MAG: alpha/beta hydrolase, partial [Candidatus Omnitrophica bacterium]|nr:alpha/beta hydrolase [Candidatus Omnitrophota bacterium]
MKLFIPLIVFCLLFSSAMLYAETNVEKFTTIDSTKGAKINMYVYERAKEVVRQNPILLVHGFNSSGETWRKKDNNYVKQLTQNGYDVIVIDMRGNKVDIDGDHKVDTPVVGDSWNFGVSDLGDDVGIAIHQGIEYLNSNLAGRNYTKADIITHST